ncbi:hypothetical protein LTR99_002816 [Exophiala xenobiotica]|uniref:Glutathione transferase n=1 Tax=Vermiconidia calcicola TaxID=1690605 RepID=A0AAV9Q8K9_9PEZI|nr:hypothetical protein LTR96_010423 [Exophiala xenobiotica]KAK5530762.1 hypothetical protein LTR23_010162 [Chaetothyriales sp. CCFEE 6169]KAK5538486.1 hypothetical protein LTR25_004028 [Vermiconidia calcicola]KAK5305274.1 hypothetical protein LTR99_002816 [Exophiala xenobiotica]KAK5333491.1 hypothetical protein LTR98_010466 [Exophiala xenobiotica]
MTAVRKAEPMVDGSLVNYILDVTQYPKLRLSKPQQQHPNSASPTMTSLATMLGLKSNGPLAAAPPNNAPYHAIFNFLFAYVFLSSRFLKNSYGLDHNVNPREDVLRFGERAVQEGKITRSQLNLLKRNEAAHANAMEHFPMFIGSALFATVAKVPNETINKACLVYSASRLVYAVAYLTVDKAKLSYIRSLAWWASNFTCLYLLWQSGKTMNASLA